ncbi:MAG: hypothetical protein WD267_08490 [Balneolales bacterium]
MKLYSNFENDIRTDKTVPGSYERWYFDAVSYDKRYRIVVIFYEGNPFSAKYIKNLRSKREGDKSRAFFYPALSISVYEDNKTIFDSQSEYPNEECSFGSDEIYIRIGNNELTALQDDGDIIYSLNLVEELPSGDRLIADLSFKSEECGNLTNNHQALGGHLWNLAQPKANVSGRIYIYQGSRIVHRIKMAGLGYHDHSIGRVPLKNQYVDWYWGRFHFDAGTLIYYVMNHKEGQQHKAWLIDPFNQTCLMEYDQVKISETQLNRFLLAPKRKIEMKNAESQVYIHQNQVLDSGPIFMRFSADAILHLEKNNIVSKSTGNTEYIKPSRISSRIFSPLLNRGKRNSDERTNWIRKIWK